MGSQSDIWFRWFMAAEARRYFGASVKALRTLGAAKGCIPFHPPAVEYPSTPHIPLRALCAEEKGPIAQGRCRGRWQGPPQRIVRPALRAFVQVQFGVG